MAAHLDAPRLSVLVLENSQSGQANTVTEHVDAIRTLSRHDVRTFDPVGLDRSFALDLDEFDVVVLHYSVLSVVDRFLSPAFGDRLRHFAGLKVQLVQDDYRWVDSVTERMVDLGIGVLFTLVPERELDNVWKPERLPGVERITTLAGYVAPGAENEAPPPLEGRELDIVYRGRDVPFWLGRLGREKAWIGEEVLARATAHSLRVDIDWRENARIYGSEWNAFLRSGRSTLGTESGSSITDFKGSLSRRADLYRLLHPEADFEQVHGALLAPYEGNVMMNVISPRVFEAIAAGTALVQFPGEYGGVIEPERHYIPLQKDFSNFGEVVERLRDIESLRELTQRSYEEIVASGDYSIARFVERFDRALDENGAPRAGRRAKPRYAIARVEQRLAARAPRVSPWRMPRVEALGAPIKVVIAIGLIADWAELRRLLRRGLSESLMARKPLTAPRRLVNEVLKLGLMRRLWRRGWAGQEPLAVRAEAGDDGLLFTTLADAEPALGTPLCDDALRVMPAGTPSRILWDHAFVGKTIEWPLPLGTRLTIKVGDDGVQEFPGLAELGAALPDQLRAVLLTAAPGDFGSASLPSYEVRKPPRPQRASPARGDSRQRRTQAR